MAQEAAYQKPIPAPDRFTEEFWAGASRHELVIQRCDQCGHYQHPPMPLCSQCHSRELSSVPVSGRGTVHTFTVTFHAVVPGFQDEVPYAVGLIELEEQENLRVLSNIVQTPPDQIKVGMPVEVVFDDIPNGMAIPKFRARSS